MAAHFHHVPGRLRVHVPRIKGSEAHARALESSLSAIKGIYAVESRKLTGSVVIHYDPETINPQALMLELGVGGVAAITAANGAHPLRTEISKKIARAITKAIFWYLLELATERAVPALLAAIL